MTGVDDGANLREEYTYDANGNRESAGEAGYTTGGANRLASDGTYTYQYDAEGNRTHKILVPDETYEQYFFDQRNRLTKVWFVNEAELAEVITYTYDPFDRLVKRVSDAATEYLVYDGADVALAFDGAGSLTTRYLNGPAVDQILAEETRDSSGELIDVLHMLTDHQGSVRDVTDNTGTVVDHIFYNSYGRVLNETAPSTQRTYGFAGYYEDKVTKLNGTDTRWYWSSTGDWNGEDWIGFAGGSYNLKAYVGNSPVNYTDPSGQAIWGYQWFEDTVAGWLGAPPAVDQDGDPNEYGSLAWLKNFSNRNNNHEVGTEAWERLKQRNDRAAREDYAEMNRRIEADGSDHSLEEKRRQAILNMRREGERREAAKAAVCGTARPTPGSQDAQLAEQQRQEDLAILNGDSWAVRRFYFFFLPGEANPYDGNFDNTVGALGGFTGLPGLGPRGQTSAELLGRTKTTPSTCPEPNRPPLSAHKEALGKVHDEVGKLPKGPPGKFGSPQAGDPSTKGYRLDPPHPNAAPGSPEAGWHYNWWDWTGGKRGNGGRQGAIPIK